MKAHQKSLVINNIMKGFIGGAAALTMTVLLLIVGFILINGFISRNRETSTLLPLTQESILIPQEGQIVEFAVIAHSSLRIKKITWDELREIYIGKESYWGYISGQNRSIKPMLWMEERFKTALGVYLESGEEGFNNRIQYYGTHQQLETFMNSNHGSIAIVPMSWTKQISGVKILGIEQISMAVNPYLMELHQGRKLSSLEIKELLTLGQSSIEYWDNLENFSDEPDRRTEVMLLGLNTGTAENKRMNDTLNQLFPDLHTSMQLYSEEKLLEQLNSHRGAFAFIPSNMAFRENLSLMKIRRTDYSLNLRPSFLYMAPSRAGAVGGISYIIINTLVMILFVLLIATPVGVGAAVYLVHYSRQGRLQKLLRLGTDTLAGIPSILFGLFGLVFFSQFLGFKTGLLSGALTLTVMILPTIIRTSEEALRMVPHDLMEGSMALGATRHQTLVKVIIPAAAPGILTGMILSIGRAIGETAALLFTLGSNLSLLRNLNSPMRVLSVHLYMLIRENISIENAFATATILILMVFLVNKLTRVLIGKMSGAA